MINFVECKKCRGLVADYAKTCPACGTQDPASGAPRRAVKNGSKESVSPNTVANMVLAIFAIIILLGLYACVYESEEEKLAKEQARSAKAAADKKAGFHCLSGWDGSHREVVSVVKEQLRDPSSFEHVQTRITPVSDSGEHRLTMTYRAKNGFGALTGGLVEATVRNATCSAQVVSID